MEVISFIDEQGNKLYCIGPFRERAQASRAAAGLPRISAAIREPHAGSITRRCIAIFDLLKGRSRADLIAECERQGIKKGTASTQYQRWKKAHDSAPLAALPSGAIS